MFAQRLIFINCASVTVRQHCVSFASPTKSKITFHQNSLSILRYMCGLKVISYFSSDY